MDTITKPTRTLPTKLIGMIILAIFLLCAPAVSSTNGVPQESVRPSGDLDVKSATVRLDAALSSFVDEWKVGLQKIRKR